jgi:hypothetical protein
MSLSGPTGEHPARRDGPREHGRQAARSKRDRLGGQRVGRPYQPQSAPPRAAVLEYARHGRSIGGGSPLEEEVVLTLSRRQLRRREEGRAGGPARVDRTLNATVPPDAL